MRKKIFMLASVALFAVGLAMYANQSNINALCDNNVEALTQDGDNGGNDTYQIFGESPNRVIVDNTTHVVILEGKKQAVDNTNKPINACSEEAGSTCCISTTTTVYNIEIIFNHLQDIFQGLSSACQLINYIMSFFG